jgi:hypothetical protein
MPYDFTEMPLGYSWYIFGGSGKGKTILLENIMYHNRRRFHSGFLQTPTQDVIDKFAKHMPICYINQTHSVKQIDQVDETKKKIIKQLPGGEKNDTRPIFMILDDVAYNREFCQDQIFNKITFNGRHQNFTMFLASQKYKALENNARSNVHFFCTYWDTSLAVRKAIWAEQFSCFESYEEFELVYRTVCCPEKLEGEAFARPRCLIVDKRFSSSNPAECCFYFSPQFELPEFSIGSRDYLIIGWLRSKQHDEQADDVNEQIDREVQLIQRSMTDGCFRQGGDQYRVAQKATSTPMKKRSKNVEHKVNLLERDDR